MSPETRGKLVLASVDVRLYAPHEQRWSPGGSYLSQHNAERMFLVQRRREMQERSYAKLLALKVPWGQAVQTHLEALMSSEYYYVRYRQLSHNSDDLAEAKRQNDRALALIFPVAGLQREVFEALAERVEGVSLFRYKLSVSVERVS